MNILLASLTTLLMLSPMVKGMEPFNPIHPFALNHENTSKPDKSHEAYELHNPVLPYTDTESKVSSAPHHRDAHSPDRTLHNPEGLDVEASSLEQLAEAKDPQADSTHETGAYKEDGIKNATHALWNYYKQQFEGSLELIDICFEGTYDDFTAAFTEALKKHQYRNRRDFLNQHRTITFKDDNNKKICIVMSVLTAACYNGQLEIIQFLLGKYSSLWQYRTTPLSQRCRYRVGRTLDKKKPSIFMKKLEGIWFRQDLVNEQRARVDEIINLMKYHKERNDNGEDCCCCLF